MRARTTELNDGIVAIDTEYARPLQDASHLIVEQGRAAFVDTGVNSSVPLLLAALEQQPKHRLARFHYGVQLLAAGRATDALTYLEPAIEPLDGRSPRILFVVAEAHMRLRRPDAARRLLEQALALARRFGQDDLIQPLETSLEGLEQ